MYASDAENRVDLWDLIEYGVAVSFGKAPGNYNSLKVAVFFEPGDIENIIY